MRQDADIIWNTWNAGGPFVGSLKPHAVVTVEKDWSLHSIYIGSTIAGWAYRGKGMPIRWFQRELNDQAETELPNVKSINIDRSLDTDAASCTITLYNTWMDSNGTLTDPSVLGQRGALTWRSNTPQGASRWTTGGAAAEWQNVIVPDALLRTYQGYGGSEKTPEDAIIDGNLMLTGLWLVDSVRVRTDGMLEIKCRDMAKLLVEQHLYPPIVPDPYYPMRYCRWVYNLVNVQVPSGFAIVARQDLQTTYGPHQDDPNSVYATAESDVWYGYNGSVHGHRPSDAFDGNNGSFWLGVGNNPQNSPWSTDYLEAQTWGQALNAIHVQPWAGGYQMYVSIMEHGSWVPGGGTVPYDINALRTSGGQPWSPDSKANIPYKYLTGVGNETPVDIVFDRTYNADKIRLSFRNLYRSPWGPYYFRAGVREIKAQTVQYGLTYTTVQELRREDGNYNDYAQIVIDILLWSGFHLFNDTSDQVNWGPSDASVEPFPHPAVFGNIEYTGAFATDCLTEDMFDKKPCIDPINQLKEVVGYIFFIDDEGGAHFESPNWWRAGNFDYQGRYTDFIPTIDERVNMTDYAVEYSDVNLRSEIIISSDEPTAGFDNTVTTRFQPPEASVLRGIVKPMMLLNENFSNPDEQLLMARMIAIHIREATYQGSVSCVANPGISINDQVYIYERVTAETGIHYIRSMTSQQDLDTGEYTMTLTTYRLGDDATWSIVDPRPGAEIPPPIIPIATPEGTGDPSGAASGHP